MRHLCLILFPLLALTACDPDSEPVGQSDTGGSGSQSDSGETTPGSSTGGSASDSDSGPSPETSDSATTLGTSSTGVTTTTGASTESGGSSGSDDCEESDCGPCPDGTTLEQSCEGDTWVCDCVPVGNICDLPTYVDEAASGKTVPEDCGTVTLEDPDAAYLAAHDCVLAASGAQQAYRMVAQLQGLDSNVWVGYAGSVGFVYSESSFSYEGGGIAGGESIRRAECTPEDIEDCSPGSGGGTCLDCDAKSSLVCSDPDA